VSTSLLDRSSEDHHEFEGIYRTGKPWNEIPGHFGDEVYAFLPPFFGTEDLTIASALFKRADFNQPEWLRQNDLEKPVDTARGSEDYPLSTRACLWMRILARLEELEFPVVTRCDAQLLRSCKTFSQQNWPRTSQV